MLGQLILKDLKWASSGADESPNKQVYTDPITSS